jgi:hypothetical protein
MPKYDHEQQELSAVLFATPPNGKCPEATSEVGRPPVLDLPSCRPDGSSIHPAV